MLYVVALSTGLRASELASLTPESLRLSDAPPTVTVKAAYSKGRRLNVLPWPSEILAELKAWLTGKSEGLPLWPGKWAANRYGGKMLRKDIEAAGLEYKNADGLFADFHALRHTYITNLGRHGVPLTTAQKLARHSTPVLTAARYTHIDLGEQSKEVEKLPALLGRPLGRTAFTIGQQSSSAGSKRQTSESSSQNEESSEKPGILAKNKRRGRDSNPGTPCGVSGFQDRCPNAITRELVVS